MASRSVRARALPATFASASCSGRNGCNWAKVNRGIEISPPVGFDAVYRPDASSSRPKGIWASTWTPRLRHSCSKSMARRFRSDKCTMTHDRDTPRRKSSSWIRRTAFGVALGWLMATLLQRPWSYASAAASYTQKGKANRPPSLCSVNISTMSMRNRFMLCLRGPSTDHSYTRDFFNAKPNPKVGRGATRRQYRGSTSIDDPRKSSTAELPATTSTKSTPSSTAVR
mmetsp:Transcript_90126/g.276012  ORF Transcript_90126/g.276012 Transcript_90126/m.276012 type:complete len:227 (+) Transcript_90126:425-1105(+)